MIGSQSAAQTIVTEYSRRESPFERGFPRNGAGGSERDFAELTAQLRVDWTERSALSTANRSPRTSGRGIFTVAIQSSTMRRFLRVNPFGMYVMILRGRKFYEGHH